ncbi:MAG: GspE/PulE family protein [Myxococcota bacterium]|nr:type II/IV secretion system protein [Myxococcales bacterium]
MKIGEILIDAGVVTAKQLDIALAEQAKTGAKLGVILADLGFTTEDAVSRALAEQSGVEHVDVDAVAIEPEATALVPEEVARRLHCLALGIEGPTLTVAMSNPTDIVAIDELQRGTDLFVRVVSTGHRQLLRGLDRAYGGSGDSALELAIRRATEEVAGEGDGEQRGGIVPLVDELLTMAVRRGATDLHLQPDKRVVRVRLRLDGDLQPGATLPASLLAPVVARVKVLAALDLSETRAPQDGKIQFAFEKGRIDLRVSTFPSVHGESVVVRILDQNRQSFALDALGLSAGDEHALRRLAQRPTGLVLAAGPTGSGKSTTLFALLRTIDAARRKVITLEDPVEYELPMITQCQVNEKAGLTFAAGLRSILRHDPDVVLVGEMRDPETASLALRAALTGHLVFSTLHTNGAIATIGRLVDMELDRYLIASCLCAVAAQRLVRKVCAHCAEEYAPEPHELENVGLPADTVAKFQRGIGCDRCNESGVAGREAVFELLELTPEVARLVSRGAHEDEIESAAVAQGFTPFRTSAQRQAMEGRIPLEEVARITADF